MGKRGMPKGKLLYPTEFVLSCLDQTRYMTTSEITKSLNKLGIKKNFSWNTVQKYLKMLETEHKVESLRIGVYNLWRRTEVEKDARKKKQLLAIKHQRLENTDTVLQSENTSHTMH